MRNRLKTFARDIGSRIIQSQPTRGSFSTYLIALALVGMALLARLLLAPLDAGYQYVTFFPAVALAAIIGGFWPGICVAISGAVFAEFFFTQPYYAFSIESLKTSFWSIMVFLLDGLIVSLSIEAMHRYRAKSAKELQEIQAQNSHIRQLQQETERLLQRNQLLMLNSMDGIHIMDMQGNIILANDAFCRMLGYTQEEVVKLNVADWDALHSEDDLRAQFNDLIGKSIMVETLHRCKNGDLINVEINVTGVLIEGQGLVYSSSRDVTERNKAEVALREHDALLNAVMQILPVGVWVTDKIGNIVFGNNAAQKIWGGRHYVGIEQFSEYKGWWLTSGKLIKPHEWAAARAIETGESSFAEEIEIECFDGIRKIISNSALPLMGSDGEINGAVIVNEDITQRKHQDEEINRAKMALEDLYDRAPCGYHSLDAEGRIIRINQTEANWLGYERAELLGRNIQEFQTPSSLQTFARHYPAFKKTGHIENVEYEFIRKDGSTFPILLSATMVKDADGNFVMSRSSMIDISERKQAEAALWRSQEQLQFISDHAPVCIAHYDFEQRYQFVNQRYAGMFGLHPADLIGKHMRDVLEEKIYVQASPHIEAVLTGQPVEFDITLGTTPDKFREIHVNYVPEYAASGRVAGFIAAIADITERKRAEMVLKQHKRMIDTAADGFWVTDARGNLQEANMAYAKMSGYSIEELMNMHISQLEAIETSAEQVQAHIAKIIAQGYDQFETRHRHKDGHEIDVEISTTYMADMERFIVFCHDITERKKAELGKLQDSDLRFRGTLEQVAVGFIHASLDGCFQQANQKFCEIIGYSSEELLQMNFRELTFSADAAGEEEHLLELLAGKISNFSREQRFVRKNLSLVWVNLTVSLLRKADGMPAFYICVVEDIAERKHAEVLAQQYGHLLQSSFDEIYLFDAHTLHFLLTSEGAERNLGYSDDELRQLTPLDLKPSISRKDFERRVAPLRSGERQSITFESDHRRKDGSTYLMEVRLQLMQADYPVFIAIIRDITERKRIENELSHQKEFLRQVIDADPSLIFVKDVEGRLLLANQAMATLYGMPLDEMLGDQYLPHLKRQGSEAELYMEIDREVIQKQKSMSFAHTSSFGGGERWFLTTKTPITLSDGTVNLLGISVDITESKRAENELSQSRQLLRDLVVQSESLREKERKHIARELHDELGQILTALRMNTSLLRIEFGEHNAALREKINAITELLDQSIQCTRNVVTHLRPAALDMGIIPAVKWLTDDFIKLTGIPCTFSAPADEIHLDEALAVSAFRVVQESLTNVARYAEASKVEIFLTQDADNFSVTVNDNGKGFDYMDISNHKSFGLLGMRERAIALGGVVNIYSAPQQGTQIFFVVPNQQTTTMKAEQS